MILTKASIAYCRSNRRSTPITSCTLSRTTEVYRTSCIRYESPSKMEVVEGCYGTDLISSRMLITVCFECTVYDKCTSWGGLLA